jgi:hypothetical protein
MVPPDGVPWPPEPPVPGPGGPTLDEMYRPAPAIGDTHHEIGDWRSMTDDLAPPGYVANEAAVIAASEVRWSLACVASLVLGGTALVLRLWPGELLLSAVVALAALALGLAGWRAAKVSGGLIRGTPFAVCGAVLGAAVAAWEILSAVLTAGP